jgi:hypothetical protein
VKTNKITKKHAKRIFKQQCLETVNRMRNKNRPILNALIKLNLDIPEEFEDILTQYSSELIAHLRNFFKEYGLSIATLDMEESDEEEENKYITLKGLVERIETRVLIC